MIPALAGITFVAAVVNGALGYGFSSITVPLALLFFSNRRLNPALIIIEVALNGYVLWVNRDAARGVWRRMLPMIGGLVPGVAIGTTIVAHVDPGALRLATFVVLLPLILLQAAGLRRPVRAERSVSVLFGAAVGVLYAVTTISGPPLAMMLNNQGLVLAEFRAALGVVRLAESSLTGAAYGAAGLVTADSAALALSIVPSVALGVPVGAWLIRRMEAELFRRICMSFDAWVVAFGISTLLRERHLVEGISAFAVMAAVIIIDASLLYRFFGTRRGGGETGDRVIE